MSEFTFFSRDELKALLLTVGSHKANRRLSPAEVGLLLTRAVAAGVNRREIAEVIGVSPTQVGEFLKIGSLSKEIRDIAGWTNRKEGMAGSVPFSTLAQLSSLDDVQQRRAVELILEYELTWKEVVQVMQLVRRRKSTIGECVDEILRMRPVIEKRFVFLGSIADSDLEAVLNTMTQNERDAIFEDLIRSQVSGSITILGSRLGSSTFMVVSDIDVLKASGGSADEFEHELEARLLERVK